ncbi:hypothetical protein [Flavobacterium sp. 5]|uniref:hypothetical protein n=1 Tax=Flavobacterium sp. 5 TaxID=2035199 RepID=UPI000C2BD07C|nr:hypothetical protein [Flavobacterium sp. 5]PKB15062.1 hypothetical protein CLU82_0117 [Flavobacterium sp. 5]
MKKVELITILTIGILSSCSSNNDSTEAQKDSSFAYKIVSAKGYDNQLKEVELPFTIDKDSKLTYNKVGQAIDLTVYKNNSLVTSTFIVTSYNNKTYHTIVESDDNNTYDFVLVNGKIENNIFYKNVFSAKVVFTIE